MVQGQDQIPCLVILCQALDIPFKISGHQILSLICLLYTSTSAAFSAKNSVRAPIPGPISMTLTVLSISAVSTIFWRILAVSYTHLRPKVKSTVYYYNMTALWLQDVFLFFKEVEKVHYWPASAGTSAPASAAGAYCCCCCGWTVALAPATPALALASVWVCCVAVVSLS